MSCILGGREEFGGLVTGYGVLRGTTGSSGVHGVQRGPRGTAGSAGSYGVQRGPAGYGGICGVQRDLRGLAGSAGYSGIYGVQRGPAWSCGCGILLLGYLDHDK